jgi:hypothetical protein
VPARTRSSASWTLRLSWLDALAVGENHRAERGRDQQRARDLERDDVAGEQQRGDRFDVAVLVGPGEALVGVEGSPADAGDQEHGEAEPEQTAPTRWPRSVSTSESDASTPTSMRTKRNNIMIAPV